MAVEKPSSPTDLRDQANQLMGKGDYEAAIATWTKLVALEPTADNWNDLSFANLQARRWEAAVQAGKSALKLKPDHPFALYNTGLALVEGGQSCEAAYYLQTSAAAQKDRYEPMLALARVSQGAHEYALAAYYATRAIELSDGRADALAVRDAVEAMRHDAMPADLARASVITLKDGAITLYLYREQQTGCKDRANYTLYAVNAARQSTHLPVGSLGEIPQGSQLMKTALPGGATGYWLEVKAQVGAYISYATEWRLFTRKGTEVGQVLFLSSDHLGRPSASEFLASAAAPRVQGDVVTSARMDTASGTSHVSTPWQLRADLRTAVATAGEESIMKGKLLQVGQQIKIQPTNALGVLQDQYEFDYNIPPHVQVFRGGKPLTPGALQPDMMVQITWQDSKLLRIDILQ